MMDNGIPIISSICPYSFQILVLYLEKTGYVPWASSKEPLRSSSTCVVRLRMGDTDKPVPYPQEHDAKICPSILSKSLQPAPPMA
jgi:hypothetical protein